MPSFTGLYLVLPSLNEVLLGFTGFHLVWTRFIGFYWVLLGFTGFDTVLLGFDCLFLIKNKTKRRQDRRFKGRKRTGISTALRGESGGHDPRRRSRRKRTVFDHPTSDQSNCGAALGRANRPAAAAAAAVFHLSTS